MTQKTRSLVLLVVLLVLLALIVWLWRSIPTSSNRQDIRPHVAPQAASVVTSSQLDLAIETGSFTTSTTGSAIDPIVSAATTSDLTLLVVGDIMLDRNVAARTKTSGDPAYPFRKLPADWLSGTDLTIGNLEGPITPSRRPPEKSIDFQFDPTWLPILKQQGFDALSQANNHALDQGSIGYTDSVTRLREAGFTVFGHQVDDGLIALATTTIKGERLAFLGWNNTDNAINRIQAAEAIMEAKQSADLTIAYLHWGTEYRDRPDAQNVEFAHWLIDEGVDVVIGGHPHWAQGFSSYKDKPIVWSLGNFIFDQDWSKETQQGLAIEMSVTSDTIRILPVPLSIKFSQPKIEEGSDLMSRLEALAKISDQELQQAVREGKELVFRRAADTDFQE